MTDNKIDLTFGKKNDKRDVLVTRFYSASISWNALCDYLWVKCEETPRYRIATNSICAFSIELSLKTILAICGHNEGCLRKSGHSLTSLMKKMGLDNYDTLKQTYERVSGKDNFDEILKINDNSFAKWRYIIPESGTANFIDDFDYTFMRWLQEALFNLSETLHKIYIEEKRDKNDI